MPGARECREEKRECREEEREERGESRHSSSSSAFQHRGNHLDLLPPIPLNLREQLPTPCSHPASFVTKLPSQSTSPPLDRIMSSSLASQPKASAQAPIPLGSMYTRSYPCPKSRSIQLSSQWPLCHLNLSVLPAATRLRLLVIDPDAALQLLG